MALDLESASPDELQDYLKWAKGESSTPEEALEAARQSQYLSESASRAGKPLGTLGEVIGKDLPKTPSAEEIVSSRSLPGKTAAQSAEVFGGAEAPSTAAESAQVFKEMMPEVTQTPTTSITNLPTSKAMEAREKLAQAARGSAGEGVITDLPSSKMLDARERLAKAVEGSAGEEVITDLPSEKVFKARERLAQAAKGSAGEGVIQAADTRSALTKLMDNPKLQSILSKIKGVGGELSSAGSEILEHPAAKALEKGVVKAGGLAETMLPVINVAGQGLIMADIQDAIKRGVERKRAREALEKIPLTDEQIMARVKGESEGSSELPDYLKQSTNNQGSDEDDSEEKQPIAVKPASLPSQPTTPATAAPAASAAPAIPAAPAAPQIAPSTQQPSLSDRYKEMMDRMQNITMMNQLAKAAAQIGSGIPAVTGVKGIVKPTTVDTKVLDENIALAQQMPEQFKAQLEMEHKDPNSQDSIAARKFLKDTIGVSVPDNISAAQLKEQFPVIERMLQARENAASRAQSYKQHLETLQVEKQALQEQRNARLVESTTKSIENDKQIQTLNTRQQSLKRGKELLDSGLPLTPQLFSDVMREVATGMTGTSSVAQGFVNKTDIPALQKTLANAEQYLTGKPEDLRKVMPETMTFIRKVMGQMSDGFEHDRQQRYKDLISRRIASTPSKSMKTALTSYLKEVAPDTTQTAAGAHPPGSIVKIKGKQYRVGNDGDSLEEL